MKITFNFNESTRSLVLLPEDELELCVLNDMATQCQKGTTIGISKDSKPTDPSRDSVNDLKYEIPQFRVEMKVNGK